MEIPAIYQPISLRSGDKYRYLGHHRFTASEKRWLCAEICDGHGDSHGNLVNRITLLTVRYSIDYDTVANWVRIFESGDDLTPGGAARVSAMDSTSISVIRKFYRRGRLPSESDADYQQRAVELMTTEMQNTIARRL
jgi:hypothetical protein